MPKLPVVRSRKSRVSGQPSQVAGALIPDSTQHSWRDDVGKFQRFGFGRSLIMALVGRRDGRNFGYGRQLSYAGPQALRDLSGGGHYGTVKAHSDRWHAFVRWCRSEDGPGLNDARQIDRQTLLNYAGHLRHQVEQGAICIATAQNRLSSVNRTMAALRGDQYVKVPSPSKALGMRRTSVRRSQPQGQDSEHVKRIVDVLCRAPRPSRSWREPPACVCARPFWPTCLDCNVKQSNLAELTSRMAPKVAAQVHRDLVGLR